MRGGVIIMFEGLAHYVKPTTDRVKKRYSEVRNAAPCLDLQRAVLFTDYLREHWDEPLYLRTAGAFHHVLSHLIPVIWDDELIVGNTSRYLKGAQVYPEYAWQFPDSIRASAENAGLHLKKRAGWEPDNALLPCALSPNEKENLSNVNLFWQDTNWCALCSQHLHDTLRIFESSNGWQHDFDSPFFPSCAPRGWIVITYRKILQDGLDSIILHLKECLEQSEPPGNEDAGEFHSFYTGLILSLEGIIAFAENYAQEARRLAEHCGEINRAQELYEISRICQKVPGKAPDTFREALQSFWFIHICLCLELYDRGISPGRFDQYMNPFFEHDLLCGQLSPTEALELLELFRIKSEQIIIAQPASKTDFVTSPMHQLITLAGSDNKGNPADTMLSKFMLQARMNIPTKQPVLTVRWRDDLSDFFKLKVINCIKTTGWCPDLYHDKTGTMRFANQSLAQVPDFQNWVVFRESTINNSNLPEIIAAFFKKRHKIILDLLVKDGLFSPGDSALLEDNLRRSSFHNLVREYIGIVHRTVQKQHLKLTDVLLCYNNMGVVHPLLLTLHNDLPGDTGGDGKLPSYNSVDLIIAYGMIDLAKTLTVIKKYVFDEAIFTVSEIRDAIQSDFEGTETMKQKLLQASSQSRNSTFFEETLLELLDTWFKLSDKAARTENNPLSSRRFTLVKGKSLTAQPPSA